MENNFLKCVKKVVNYKLTALLTLVMNHFHIEQLRRNLKIGPGPEHCPDYVKSFQQEKDIFNT